MSRKHVEEGDTRLVLSDIEKERRRQIEKEGWSTEHDDGHEPGTLSAAGACYALEHLPAWQTQAMRRMFDTAGSRLNAWVPYYWPWDTAWWKPKDKRQDLVRAAALIVAEIEKIDRARYKELERKLEPRNTKSKSNPGQENWRCRGCGNNWGDHPNDTGCQKWR